MADKYLNLSGLDYYDQKRKLYIDNSLIQIYIKIKKNAYCCSSKKTI